MLNLLFYESTIQFTNKNGPIKLIWIPNKAIIISRYLFLIFMRI